MIEQARGVRNIRDARLGEFGADVHFGNSPRALVRHRDAPRAGAA
jgi:hypothetical protein